MSHYDAMIRWQAYARESRTVVNSHFLAYSAAILALQTSTLTSKDVKQITWPCIYMSVGIFAAMSFLLGSIVVLVRLRDARLTARVARYRYIRKSQQEINVMKGKADFCSGWVNRLLPCQVISFACSALLYVTWVVGANMGKLLAFTS